MESGDVGGKPGGLPAWSYDRMPGIKEGPKPDRQHRSVGNIE